MATVWPVLFVQGGGAGSHDEWDDRLVDSLRRELGDGYDLPVRVRGVRTDGTVVIEGEIRLWISAKR